MNKELEFIIPEGYVIDKEKSTDGKIVYKLIENNRLIENKKQVFDIFDGLKIDVKTLSNSRYICYKKDDWYYLLYDKKTKTLYFDMLRILNCNFNSLDVSKLIVKECALEYLNLDCENVEPHYVKVLIDVARDKEYRSLQNKKLPWNMVVLTNK